MSENLPEKQNPEEVDLGQLFKLIGRAFERFFNFIGNIFYKLFLAIVWMVFFTKRHWIKLALAAAIGIGIGFFKEKIAEPVYKSSIVVRQNYGTGENLSSYINRYNDLISERDSVALANSLQITPDEASTLLEFRLESVLDENQKLRLYNSYVKDIDSLIAKGIDFKTFLARSKDYDFSLQKITLKTKSKNIFEKVLTKTVENVQANTFFKNQQKKDLAELDRRENIIRESLKESDSLQKVYQIVLEKSVEQRPSSQTSITIDNTEDKSTTKEFELFNKDLELRRELVQIARKKEDLEHIIEIVSSVQNEGTVDNTKEVFGTTLSQKVFYGLALVVLVYVLLFAMEFLKYLERFRDKV